MNRTGEMVRDSAGTAATAHRVAVLVALLAFLAAFRQSEAQEMPAPVQVQWALLSKILTFERNLTTAGEKVVVGVVFQSEVRASVLAKDELMAAIKRSRASGRMRFSCQAVRLIRVGDLGKATEASSADVLYITPMRAVDIASITKQTRAGDTITLTGVPEYVAAGVAVGLEAGFSMADLHAQVARSRTAVALVSLVVFLVGSAAVFAISTVVARPLGQMVEAAEQIEEGDLSRRVTVFARDEVGQLAEAFNAMVERIEERTTALQREISDRKEAEEAKRRAEEELETQRSLSMRSDRLRSLGEMAAGIAHELNQPLAAARGLAEHILIGRERMSIIIDQADRMTHIIEHVRMFALAGGGSYQSHEQRP